MLRLLPFILILLCSEIVAAISYTVDFEGVNDSCLLKELKAVSALTSLKKRPPASFNALRYRADADIPGLIKVLHAYGYYDATVKMEIQGSEVIVQIDLGKVYTLQDYTIRLYNGNFENPITCDRITLCALEINLEKPALAESIIKAELKLLELLADCGYPLATVDKREILADAETKTIHVNVEVNSGPLAKFGELTLAGDGGVKPSYICQKVLFYDGELYASSIVESTQKKLMETGLFSSILITHDDALTEDGTLKMSLDVTETKHRSISFGASYQTFYGFGFTFNWEHRNLGGMGRKIGLQGDITQRSQTGVLNYLIPGFFRPNQDYVIQAEAGHEDITPYSDRTYNFLNRVERRVSDKFRVTGGIKLEQLLVTDSAANGNFYLTEVPFYLRWSNADDLLNPTEGMTFEYTTTPSVNYMKKNIYYLIQEFSYCNYFSLLETCGFIFAQKITLGSIFSTGLDAIPLPKRFLGGSEEELRGYRYRTVSPLNSHGKPLGGRSAVYYTAEFRFRLTKTIGIVPFFDLGNVEFNMFPPFTGKWYKSLGLGFRYFSFFGPIRVDFAVPLDRRKELDPAYRFLVDIGQTF